MTWAGLKSPASLGGESEALSFVVQ